MTALLIIIIATIVVATISLNAKAEMEEKMREAKAEAFISSMINETVEEIHWLESQLEEEPTNEFIRFRINKKEEQLLNLITA